jgi:hypothetical protein
MYSIAELRDHFNSEQLLIIMLARLYFGTTSKEEMQQFLAEHKVDPGRFEHLTSIHGVRPFVYHVLTENNLEVPGLSLNPLKEFYIQNHRRSMEQLLIVSRLQKELAAKQVTAIPYKGVGFSYKYYGNLGLRESSDIDFLIAEEDADAVEDHLIQQSYIPKTTVPPYYRKYYRRHFKDISYSAPSTRAERGYSVEMHWRLLNAHYGDFPSHRFFKEGLIPVSISGVSITSLAPTYDFLAVGSNHFVKDLSTRFKYLLDIAGIIHTSKLDAGLISEVVKTYRCEKRFGHGLFLIESLLGKRINGYVVNHGFAASALCYTLEPSLIKIKISDPGFLKRSLALQDSFSDKIKFMMRCLYNYPLPMATDIHRVNKRYPLPFLVALRLSRSARKAVQRLTGKKMNSLSS